MNIIFSFAIGTGKQNKKGQWLEVFYPEPQLGVSEDVIEIVKEILWYDGGNEALSATNEQIRILCERLDRINEHQLAQQARLLSDSKDHLVVTVLATDAPPHLNPRSLFKASFTVTSSSETPYHSTTRYFPIITECRLDKSRGY